MLHNEKTLRLSLVATRYYVSYYRYMRGEKKIEKRKEINKQLVVHRFHDLQMYNVTRTMNTALYSYMYISYRCISFLLKQLGTIATSTVRTYLC